MPESEGLNPNYLDKEPGRVCRPAEGQIVYQPFLYRGKMHSFQVGPDGWRDDRIVEAFQWPEAAQEQEGWHKVGYFSIGLFCNADGSFFTVYLKNVEGRPRLWINAFDPAYQLESAGPLEPQPSESTQINDYILMFECRDSLGRYIVSDNRRIPQLLVARLTSETGAF